MKAIKSVLVLGAMLAAGLPAGAAISPHETISSTVDGAKITIVYGRPYTRDPKTKEPRQIWGKLVPYGKVWRTGADAATLLTTDKTLMIGDTEVEAGTYSLYTLPEEDGGKLIINKQTGQWGTQYNKDKDLARVDLKKETLEKPLHQFTMAIENNPSGSGGVIKLMWENTQYTLPFTVKK
jgi:Protein of unknown function (DUF2911)